MNNTNQGYKSLSCYKLGLVIQELTEEFTNRWVKSYRRKMQMDEAARSNPQCVAEGHIQPSLKGFIKLSGISRGSNEELANDYIRFLNKHNLPIWPKDHTKVREFRAFRAEWKAPNTLNTPKLPEDKEKAANMLLTFCQMEGFLLRRLVESLEEKHRTDGGLTERLYRKRKQYRGY